MEHIEGRQPVLEALRAGRRRVRAVFLQEALRDRAAVTLIEEAASERGVSLASLPRDEFARRSRTDSPQGVMAECDPLPLVPIHALVDPPPALVLVLDGVTD